MKTFATPAIHLLLLQQLQSCEQHCQNATFMIQRKHYCCIADPVTCRQLLHTQEILMHFFTIHDTASHHAIVGHFYIDNLDSLSTVPHALTPIANTCQGATYRFFLLLPSDRPWKNKAKRRPSSHVQPFIIGIVALHYLLSVTNATRAKAHSFNND